MHLHCWQLMVVSEFWNLWRVMAANTTNSSTTILVPPFACFDPPSPPPAPSLVLLIPPLRVYSVFVRASSSWRNHPASAQRLSQRGSYQLLLVGACGGDLGSGQHSQRGATTWLRLMSIPARAL